MAKVDIISGFLGAGKTTLIKKLLAEAYEGEQLALIENEFGEISVDGGFLQEAGIRISEMSSGCICCTLVGNFAVALQELEEQYHPDRILIEPSGVGKLSDVVAAVRQAAEKTPALELNSFVTVADAVRAKIYVKNFGEFYDDQISSAQTIILSRTQNLTPEKLEATVELLRGKNPSAAILTTPWDELDGKTILSSMEKVSLEEELMARIHEDHHHHHHHDEHCNCGCHDHEHHHHEHHDEHCDCGCHDHEHHHHDHDEHCDCGCHDHDHEHHHHEHHHDHDEHCACGCHDHDHGHHHHHADEVFSSWGCETPRPFGRAQLETILNELDTGEYGDILRAKGILPCTDGGWLHFDYVPGECQLRSGSADYTGRLCVIGANLNKKKLAELFGL